MALARRTPWSRRCILDTQWWASRRYIPAEFRRANGHINDGFIDQHLFTADRTAVVFQKWRWTAIAVTLGLVFVASLRKEWPMTFIAVRCPHCQSDQIVKRGKTARGTQRYLCQNPLCATGGFLLDYGNRGCLPEVKHMIIDMRLNASGVRDTARSLHTRLGRLSAKCGVPKKCCSLKSTGCGNDLEKHPHEFLS